MRYRAIGPDGLVVSAVSLELAPDPKRPRPGDWVSLIYAALECGISTFELRGADGALLDGAAQAFASVDRRLVFVGLRLGRDAGPARPRDFTPDGLMAQVSDVLHRTALGRLDAVLLDEPLRDELQTESIQALRQLKSAGHVRFSGVAGEGEAIDHYISGGAFDLLATPFNLTSGWRERNRMRLAAACNMTVIGYSPYPRELHAAATAAAKAAPARRGPLDGCGTYAFLDRTPGWSAEAICLAYALTDPCLATVLVQPGTIARVEALAAVPEREMPPGLAAQIEMARFMPQEANQRRA